MTTTLGINPEIEHKQTATPNIVFFGDLHARNKLLQRLVSDLRDDDPDVRIIGVGDVVGKKHGYGNNRLTLELMKERSIEAVLGNHELALLAAMNHSNEAERAELSRCIPEYLSRGILEEFGVTGSVAEAMTILRHQMAHAELYEVLNDMPTYIETDSSIAIHGLLRANSPWQAQAFDLDAYNSDMKTKRDYSDVPWQIECDVRVPEDDYALPVDFNKTLVVGNMELDLPAEARIRLGGRLILLGGLQGPNKPLPIYREKTGKVELFS